MIAGQSPKRLRGLCRCVSWLDQEAALRALVSLALFLGRAAKQFADQHLRHPAELRVREDELRRRAMVVRRDVKGNIHRRPYRYYVQADSLKITMAQQVN